MTKDIVSSVVGSMHPTVSSLKTSNYQIIDTDYFVGIGTLISNITIKLPQLPNTNDQYIIKDVSGTAGDGYIATIDGYGNNIDGLATFVLAQPFASITIIFTGTQWSISQSYAGSQNGNGYGLLASMPVQGQAGRTYYATDSGAFYYDDGASWKAIGQSGIYTVPKLVNFSWQNQNGATATDFGSGMFIHLPAGNGFRFLYQNVPSTPYTLTAKFIHLGTFEAGSSTVYGLAWGDGTKLITAHINDGFDAMNFDVACWDNTTTFNSELLTFNSRDIVDNLEWFRISDNGTNRSVSVSRDGVNFVSVYSGSNTTFLTATRIGIAVYPYATSPAYTSCVSFEIT